MQDLEKVYYFFKQHPVCNNTPENLDRFSKILQQCLNKTDVEVGGLIDNLIFKNYLKVTEVNIPYKQLRWDILDNFEDYMREQKLKSFSKELQTLQMNPNLTTFNIEKDFTDEIKRELLLTISAGHKLGMSKTGKICYGKMYLKYKFPESTTTDYDIMLDQLIKEDLLTIGYGITERGENFILNNSLSYPLTEEVKRDILLALASTPTFFGNRIKLTLVNQLDSIRLGLSSKYHNKTINYWDNIFKQLVELGFIRISEYVYANDKIDKIYYLTTKALDFLEPPKETILDKIKSIKTNRTVEDSLLYAMTEIGELSDEILKHKGFSNKDKQDNGIVLEAIDVIVSCLDIIQLQKPDITQEEIDKLLHTKIDKWKNKNYS